MLPFPRPSHRSGADCGNDAQVIQAAVQAAERKRDAEYRNQMVALEENFDVLRKTMNRDYARLEGSELGAGQ